MPAKRLKRKAWYHASGGIEWSGKRWMGMVHAIPVVLIIFSGRIFGLQLEWLDGPAFSQLVNVLFLGQDTLKNTLGRCFVCAYFNKHSTTFVSYA